MIDTLFSNWYNNKRDTLVEDIIFLVKNYTDRIKIIHQQISDAGIWIDYIIFNNRLKDFEKSINSGQNLLKLKVLSITTKYNKSTLEPILVIYIADPKEVEDVEINLICNEVNI